MTFPEASLLTLEQATERWQVTLEQVQYAILEERLKAYTWIPATLAHRISRREFYEANQFEKAIPVKGYRALLSEDCRALFQQGPQQIHQFQSGNGEFYYIIVRGLPAPKVEMEHLVIPKAERDRFEKEFGIQHSTFGKSVSVRENGFASNSKTESCFDLAQQSDFRELYFKGKHLLFGEIQAQIIKQLYQASQTTRPWAYGKTLLDKVGSQSMVMRDIFKHQPQWRDIIESNSKRYYRLNPEIVGQP